PLAPGTARSRETGFDLSPGGQDERFLIGGAEDKQAAAARPRREAASDRGLARRRLAGSERADGDRVAAGRRDWYAGSALESCRGGGVAEPGLDPPAHGHLARETPDLAREFAVGAEPSFGQCHCI